MSSSLRPFLGPALAFAAVAAAGALLFLDLCDLIYRCGCVAWWAGGAAHCNIRIPGPPDCPFCAWPAVSAGACFAGMGAQAGILLRPKPPGGLGALAWRSLAALAAFGVVLWGIGAALGFAVGYWR